MVAIIETKCMYFISDCTLAPSIGLLHGSPITSKVYDKTGYDTIQCDDESLECVQMLTAGQPNLPHRNKNKTCNEARAFRNKNRTYKKR